MKLSYRITMAAALSLLLCTAASAQIVINEIDYDQPSTDTAEFIELYNAGNATVDLTNYRLSFINGSNVTEYVSVPLTGFSLGAGEFLVVCGNSATTPNCDLDISPDTNLIQNGAPDAVVLYDGLNVADAVSYEGETAGYGEGTGAPSDTGANAFEGISRYPDGNDTDDNHADFFVRCATPGWPNAAGGAACSDPVPATESEWGTIKAMFR